MLNNQTLQQPPDGGQTPPSGDPQGQTPPTSQGQTTTTPPQGNHQQQSNTSHLTDHWTEADREYIKRLRDEAKVANDALAEIRRKEAEAEQERLKQAGKFEDLARQYEARVKELEPIATSYSDLAQEIHKQIDADIKDWPKSVKALDPGASAEIKQRLAWKASAQAIVAEMGTQAQGQAPGSSPNPRPIGGQQASDQNIEILRQRYQAQRGNPF